MLPPIATQSALEYETHLDILISKHRAHIEEGTPLTASKAAEGLLPGANNKKMRSFAMKEGVRAKDFDAALRTLQIVNALGELPTSPEHFLQLVVERDQIKCRYNGLLSQAAKPQIPSGKNMVDITAADLTDPRVATIAYFSSSSRLTASELALKLRTTSVNHKLGFSDASIRDAVDQWMRSKRRERLSTIYIGVAHAALPVCARAKSASVLSDLVAKVFDTSELPVEFVAAVLAKFIWQVKRKMRGLPITNHLMVVILGPQGAGKSVFVRYLIGPVEEVAIDADFAALEESRNIDLWSFYVHVLDEMGYATKADCETIKRVLTSETLSRRPMGMNSVEIIPQNATMIGCSNKELDQLINDATGNRRFAPIRFRRDADWAAVTSADYKLIWQSIDEHGPDPMAQHMDTLRQLQAASKQLGPVEQWLTSPTVAVRYRSGQKIKPEQLYAQYREWEVEYRPGNRALDFSTWKAELNRLLKNDKGLGELPFQRADARASYGYPIVCKGVSGAGK